MQIFSDDMAKRLSDAGEYPYSFCRVQGAAYIRAHRGVKLIGDGALCDGRLGRGPIIEQIVERVDHSYTPKC